MWYPEAGKEYNVRIIPIPGRDGEIFVDRYYYYGVGSGQRPPMILAPYQFNKPDPIQELITKLHDDGSPTSRDMAKKLYPKMRSYAAVIVRGEEEKGVRLWSFGKTVYQDILRLILDEDYGDITDPESGRDIKLQLVQVPGKTYADTKITPRGGTSPLSKDKEVAKKWLTSIPDINQYEECPSAEEIEKRINAWLSAGSSPSSEAGTSESRERATEEVSAEAASKLSSLDGSEPRRKSGRSKMPVDDEIEAAFADLEE